MRDPRHDVLFEPVRIGPVTAKNRFFQVPHCNGMGFRDPSAHAEMRAVKAEGGWAVVCTEETEIHYSAETSPYIEMRNWSDDDLPALTLVADKIHDHGALAGVELIWSSMDFANLYTREPPMGPAHLPVSNTDFGYGQARRMDKDDIADVRRWHRQAVERALKAGYDLIYIYAAHHGTGLEYFLSRRWNDRTDEYGGSIENRARLLREVLEDTQELVAGRAAVACRLVVDELIGPDGLERGEIEEVLGLVGEVPDLWDFVIGDWEDDAVTSRLGAEGHEEPYVRGLSDLTSKPVVGVGRFTSPDLMVRLVREGVIDLIGAARPSIADPFLPTKIDEGRADEICECIGCNICVSGDMTISPIRCTQNASMGEEWRRGWHPERIRARGSEARVLVVGAGPAGLEASVWLGRRGYEVVLVEASRRLGGRVAAESTLPGLAAWRRVVDYREGQLDRLDNVEHFFESPMTAAEVLGYGFDHVAVATGATWRGDGVGHVHTRPMEIDRGMEVLSPNDLMAGARPRGNRVVLFDDDHYYLGGVLAELLRQDGYAVTLITPAADVSHWTHNTLEQHAVQRRLIEAGIEIVPQRTVQRATDSGVVSSCVFTETESEVACDSLVMVTSRLPDDALVEDLRGRREEWPDAGLSTVRAVGDALCPSTIAAAVWDGRRYAEELDGPERNGDTLPFRREVTAIADPT